MTNLDKQHEADSSQCLNPSASNTDNRNSCPSISNFHPIASLPETSLLHAVENTKNYPYSGGTSTDEVNPYYYAMLFDEETQPGTPTGVVSRLTIGQKQMFSIKEISPEWGYSAENSKVRSIYISVISFCPEILICMWVSFSFKQLFFFVEDLNS